MKRVSMIVILLVVLMSMSITIAIADGSLPPEANGKAVYDYVTTDNPYQQWSLFPGKGKLYEGKHPHGAFLTTYVNDLALQGINNKVGTLADGSIIVKENYMPDKTLGAVTVMYRVHGYNAEAGDWFWAKYKADGTIEKEGKVGGCIGCHTAVIANDWIFTGPVK